MAQTPQTLSMTSDSGTLNTVATKFQVDINPIPPGISIDSNSFRSQLALERRGAPSAVSREVGEGRSSSRRRDGETPHGGPFWVRGQALAMTCTGRKGERVG
jgi:hypothetical protein